MIVKTLALTILTEALVKLIFMAAPLQSTRQWIIKKTPWLKSIDQGHLLECKYCTSVWIAGGVILLATFADCQALRLVSYALITARLSNYVHLIISSIWDAQINMRLKR